MARTSTDSRAVAATAGSGSDPAPGELAMTPAAALARHLEWLEFALAAATAEEAWRRDRLAKASKRNRVKREDRLAEVTAEIAELSALISGIRDLGVRAARKNRAKAAATPVDGAAPRRRGRPRKTPLPASAAPAAPAASAPAVDGAAPRRRGRPRKTPAAPAAPAGSGATATPAAPAADAAPRRRGRPRKTPPAG